jgi:hypothetical protein
MMSGTGTILLETAGALLGKVAVRVVPHRTGAQPFGRLGESCHLVAGDEAVEVITDRYVDSAILKPGDRGVDLALVEVGNNLLLPRIGDAECPFAFPAFHPLTNLGRVTGGLF